MGKRPRCRVAVGALVAALAGCRGSTPVPSFPGAPVVLVSIDTLRADRLPAYGYRGVETPHLDRFRKDALLFRNAWSPCPMTLPSHVTMLTGLQPYEHGVRLNVGFTFDGAAHPSLPRLLQAKGYATGAAVSSYVLRGETGLAAIFQDYEATAEPRLGAPLADQQRSGRATAALAKRWIDGRAGRPFFHFFHVYEPHVPYDPPEPFRGRYPDAYDGEVAAADAAVGELLEHLRAKGLYDRSVIVVTSDHGEGLGDHGEDQHSILLYVEAIRVPLLLKLPGSRRGGATLDAPAQLADILPTIAGLVGTDPPEGLPGRSLLDLDDGEGAARPAYAETLYPRLQLGWSELRSLVDGRWHYIEGPRPELYDLQADPGETRDLVAREPAQADRLRRALAAFPAGPEAPGPVDPATAERLSALGYLGTARSRGPGDLPNPRDQLPLLGRLREGFRLAGEGRPEAAAVALAGLVRDHPDLIEAWIKLGDVLGEAGRPAEAASAFAQAAERSPVFLPDVVLALGHARLAAGERAAAAAAADRAEAALPAQARELRARVALAEGRLDEAEEHAGAAGGGARPPLSAALLLAEVRARRGDLGGALALLDETAAAATAAGVERLRGLETLRADALARMGRTAEAESAYRREIAALPGNLTAHANLAALLFSEGRRREVGPLLEEMAAKNPGARACRVAAVAWEAFGDRRQAAAWRARESARLAAAEEAATPGGTVHSPP